MTSRPFNDECSICMEDFDEFGEFDNSSLQLNCNHKFHLHCLCEYITIEYKSLSIKQGNNICCKQFKCPLCRTSFVCKDVNSLTYSKYKDYHYLKKQIKKDIKRLQNESYIHNFKFSVKKLFRSITPSEAYKYLMEEETYLEVICEKKNKLYEIKELKDTYRTLYYKNCICCNINTKNHISQRIFNTI